MLKLPASKTEYDSKWRKAARICLGGVPQSNHLLVLRVDRFLSDVLWSASRVRRGSGAGGESHRSDLTAQVKPARLPRPTADAA